MAARLSTCAYNLIEYRNRLDQSDHFNVRSVCFIDSQSFLCFGTSGRRAIISSVSSIGGEMVQKINHISLENESVQLWKWEEVKRHSAIILSDLLMYIYKHDHAITARWELAYKVNLKEHLLMGMPGRIVDIWIDLGIHRLFYIFQDEDLTAVKQCVVSINDDEHVVNITPGLTLYTLHVLVDQLYSDHVLYTIDLGDSGYTLTANTHAIGRVFRSSFQSLGLLCDVNDSSSIQFVSSNQFISGMEGAKKSMSATTFVHVRVNDRLYRIRCDMNSRMTGLSLVGSIALPIVGKEVSVLASNESTIFVLSSCRHRSTTAMNIEKLDLFRWDIALGEYTITSIPLEMAARGPLSAIVQAGLHFEVDDSGTRSICTALGLADGKLLCLHGVSREAGDLNNWTLLQWLLAATPEPLPRPVPDIVTPPMPLDGIPAVSSMNAESSSSSSSSLSSSCSLVGVEKIVWSELRTAIMNGFASGSGLWFDETHEDAEVKITELLTEIREISAKEGLSRLSCEAWREEEDCLIAITVNHPMVSAVHRLQPAPLSLISSELLWWDQLDIVSLAPPHLRRVGRSSSELLQSFGWQELVAHELDALVVADVMQYLESPSDSQALNTLPFFLREYMRNHPDDCFAGICGLVDLFLSSKQLDWWTYRLRKAGLQVVLLTESCPGSSRSLNDLTWLQAASKRPVPVEEVPQQSALSSSSTTVRKVEVLRGYQLLMEEIASAASACAREEIQRRFLPSTPDLDITKVDEICKILLLSGKVLTVAYFLANLQLITPLFVFCQRLAASANFLALAPTKMTSHPSLFTGKDTDLDYYHSASSDYYNHGRGREMRGWDLLHRPPLPSDRVQSLSFDQSQPIKTAPTESNSLNRKRMEQAIIVFLLTVEKLILFGDWSEGNDSTVLDMLKEIVHYRPWGVTLQQTLGTLSVCKGQDKEQKLTSLISTMFT